MMPTKTDRPAARTPRPGVPTWTGLAALDPAGLAAMVSTLDVGALPPVNTSLVSPTGFDAFEDDAPGFRRPVAELRTTPSGGLRIMAGGTRLASLDDSAILSAADLAMLRPYAAVRVPFAAAVGPVELARVLRQLLVGGVPLLGPDLPLSVRRLLGTELGDMIVALTPDVVTDPDRREQWSVDVRRLALWSATSAGGVPSSRPTVTAVVDADEPARLVRVLRELRAQTWPALAVVVAAADDDIVPSPPPSGATVIRAASRVEARRRAILDCESDLATTVIPRLSYGPEHVRDLVLGQRYGGRAIAGVVVRRTYLEALDITVQAPGEPSERPSARLSAGTLLAPPSTLLATMSANDGDDIRRADAGNNSEPVTVGDKGYAIHDRNVHRTILRNERDFEATLRAGGRQVPGETGRTTWMTDTNRGRRSYRVDPAYVSYFSRTDASESG